MPPLDAPINKPSELRDNFPRLNPNASPIQEPVANDLNSIFFTVRQLKMAVDSLIGQIGPSTNRAVTFDDLVTLGLTTRQQLAAARPSAASSRVDKLETAVGGFTGDLADEAAIRAAADLTLQANIDAEAATRTTNDNTLQTNINTEASTRAAADTTLQNNIDLKANIASPTFTGDPRAPTPATADNDTSIATTAFVKAQGYVVYPTWTVGSVAYATSTTALGQDNANLFWDGTNHRLGIGNAAPAQKLDVTGFVNVSGGYAFGNATVLLTSGNYVVHYDQSVRTSVFLGGTGDPANYYRNATHSFQNVGGGVTYLTLDNANDALWAKHLIPTVDNTYTLGRTGARWAAVWAANGTIQTSDMRAKVDVEECDLGLEFVCKLKPISYRWQVGGNNLIRQDPILSDEGMITGHEMIAEPVPGKRRHYGLAAQQVKDVLGPKDFGGWVLTDKDDPDSEQALRMDQFIAPLIRAVQELATRL